MSVRRLFQTVLAVAVLAGCHTITEELPQQEQPANPGAPAGTPVVVVPVPIPSPVAPSPTPPPSNPSNPAQPTPAPPPSNPGTQSCPLPPGRWNENCVRESPAFLSQVEAAIDDVVRNHPGIFDTRRTRGCGTCYQVLDPTAYVNRVTQAVTRNGVCGYYDGEELGVKNTNGFNDQFDILTSDMFIRRQAGSYRSTCRPAWF